MGASAPYMWPTVPWVRCWFRHHRREDRRASRDEQVETAPVSSSLPPVKGN